MSLVDRPEFLRTVLLVDAVTCVATGALMTIGAELVSRLTQIPQGLLMAAGLSLFPIAAFIAFVATRRPLLRTGVWLVIIGNVGWVLGSVLALVAIAPNGHGYAFIITQAVAVAILAELEITGLRRLPAAA
ncbi:hypothetical protein [Reyranella sp. CPCC 100927]|uniref:hypothetical protein n=1 Tax=Reyranella sp. CPCC 100927 TaxID=2599616 RepID=UPI0011B4E6D8|nr:hypothetical protein [Reyranella sp. CPCC 100927]TWT15170.1 hypothetical protein FQU96_02055 [Reyranella sp. CPCC 100927]